MAVLHVADTLELVTLYQINSVFVKGSSLLFCGDGVVRLLRPLLGSPRSSSSPIHSAKRKNLRCGGRGILLKMRGLRLWQSGKGGFPEMGSLRFVIEISEEFEYYRVALYGARSSMVEHRSVAAATWVRFPSGTPVNILYFIDRSAPVSRLARRGRSIGGPTLWASDWQPRCYDRGLRKSRGFDSLQAPQQNRLQGDFLLLYFYG